MGGFGITGNGRDLGSSGTKKLSLTLNSTKNHDGFYLALMLQSLT